ncbi:hypothetical protein LX87_04292 [Larkinella arboricola]|uniref:Outer membrane protein with beta-barrel domain n=1 Tax=Larkinella arboricola TaxID=643671 RepID=A0A327WXZ9_LARAB|nr:hypothetical protein [Larkinella arboricola]RAJ94405.1 hypothetical protein LX87_04292 [Larkinella arboricola]
MKHHLLALVLCTVSFSAPAQALKKLTGPKNPEWKAESVAQHQRGSWLIGAGLTLLGATAKAGYFPAHRFWVGVEGEVHGFLSNRKEAGLFARYYLWNGGFISGFAESGVSYGHFQGWDMDIDNETPGSPTRYESAKLNGALGLEITLSRQFSIEGVGKIGKLTDANWFQPSFQASLNVYLGRK